MALSIYQTVLVVGMLVTGSINTISKKGQNQCVVKGYPHDHGGEKPHHFDHPWFQTVIMFIGEATCLFGLVIYRKRERDRLRQEAMQEALDTNAPVEDIPPQLRIFQIIIALPTVCDLFGTSLTGIGLLYVNASVWQMLRGSIIVFTGIFSRVFLKRKLRPLHWLGICVVIVGLTLVGVSSILKDRDSGVDSGKGSKVLFGILMIMLGNLVAATQMIVEEVFLKKKQFPPLHVVGMEGSFGVFFMAAIVLPVMYFIPGSEAGGRYENSLDALYQIKNSGTLLGFCLLYLASIAFYNFFGLAVTKSLTAVHRTLIDACRTVVVWIVELILYYGVDENFGEPFDKTYGLLQVDGFIFLLIGTCMYNQLIDIYCIPCLSVDNSLVGADSEVSATQPSIQHGTDEDPDERTALLGDKD